MTKIPIILICISINSFVLAQSQSPKKWGIYQIYWGDQSDVWFQKAQKEFTTLGATPDYLMFFRDLEYGFPTETLNFVYSQNPDIEFVLSLELTRWRRPKAVPYLELVGEGHFDDFFKDWADAAKSYGHTVYLRFGFEMNGDWFEWGQNPELFKKAWVNIHKVFQSRGASNVKWIFSPNVLWADKSFKYDILPYYPGDQWVDIIGLDGYNFGDQHDEFHKWQSFEEVFESTIKAVSYFNKPIWITELSSAPDERKALWIKDFLLKFKKDQRLDAFIWFQYDKRFEGELDWRVQSDSMSLKGFKDFSDFLRNR